MQLPNEIVVLIAAGIGFLVTNGLKALFPKLDISGVGAQVTAALVTAVVVIANWLLSFVPAQYQQLTVAAFTLIISVLGAFGLHYTLKQQRAK